MNDTIHFSVEQRELLGDLGVLDEQISRLETILPLCRAHVASPAPALTDVTDLLERVVSTALEFEKAVAAISSDQHRSGARVEARARFLLASFERLEREGDATDFNQLGPAAGITAAAARQVATEALEPLRGADQRRRRSATPTPIYLINEALQRGWGDAYYPVRSGPEDAATSFIEAAPPYPFTASRNVTSKFRQIVGICYATFLDKLNADPERAIRTYITERRWRPPPGQQPS